MTSFRYMPICRSFLRVRLRWHARAAAMRCCQWRRRLAMSAISTADARPHSHQLGTNAPTAACTWLIVRSGFFPPKLRANPRQEQVAHRSQYEVPLQAQPAAAFPLVQANLLLLVLETSLHTPTRKRHQQHGLHTRPRRRVAYEKLDLHRVQNIACHDQVKPHPGQLSLVLDRDPNVLHLPN